jgi:hypothetical protein
MTDAALWLYFTLACVAVICLLPAILIYHLAFDED